MKTLSKVLMMTVVVLMVISCKKDDPKPSLVGTWTLATYLAVNCTDPGDNADETCTSSCTTFVFTETTLTVTDPGSSPDVLTYTTSGTNTITLMDGTDVFAVATYTISGSVLTATFVDPDTGCTTTFTANKAS